MLGGWQLGGIFTMQSGFPFTVLCGPGNIQNGGGVCYPDATGVDWQLPGSERSRTRYFNTAAFVDRTNPGGPFRYGTVPRNSLIGPGIISLDASANKRFSLGGSKYDRGFASRSSTCRTVRSGISPGTSCGRPTSASSPAPGSTRGRSSLERSWCSDTGVLCVLGELRVPGGAMGAVVFSCT